MADDPGRIKIVEQRWALLRYATVDYNQPTDSLDPGWGRWKMRRITKDWNYHLRGLLFRDCRIVTFASRAAASEGRPNEGSRYTPVRVRVTTEVLGG